MTRTFLYPSPLGEILLTADAFGLTGLYFKGQKHFPTDLLENSAFLSVLYDGKCWLDLYFSGKQPHFTPQLHLIGTDFQKEIWKILSEIPYGKVTSYSAVAATLAARRGISHMSAQAVGGAIGHNPVSIILPCHRVLGADGTLTGYAGGLERKRALLALEGHSIANE